MVNYLEEQKLTNCRSLRLNTMTSQSGGGGEIYWVHNQECVCEVGTGLILIRQEKQ
jgi:hypothetical protein